MNPLVTIQNRYKSLLADKEIVDSEIRSLEVEKRAIEATLPKIVYELLKSRENIQFMTHEREMYDRAIEEIEKTYGHIIYSPKFFSPARFEPSEEKAIVSSQESDEIPVEAAVRSPQKKNMTRSTQNFSDMAASMNSGRKAVASNDKASSTLSPPPGTSRNARMR